MTEKFTPGPWGTVGDGKHGVVYVVNSPDKEDQGIVAEVVFQRCAEKRNANAHLISAAPDMYRALEDVCSDCEILSNWEDLFNIGRPDGTQMPPCPCKDCYVEKALKKARGEE